MSHDAIENLSHEDRAFPPSAEFAAQANATDGAVRRGREPTGSPSGSEQARELQWETPWTTALDWSNAPFATLVRRRERSTSR